MVVALALGSIVLALGLGYVFSWSLVGPLTEIEARLRQIAAGDFTGASTSSTATSWARSPPTSTAPARSSGRLYRQIEERTGQLQRSVGELRTLSEVSKAVNSSLDLDKVLASIAAHAASLAEADTGIAYGFDRVDGVFRLKGCA